MPPFETGNSNIILELDSMIVALSSDFMLKIDVPVEHIYCTAQSTPH